MPHGNERYEPALNELYRAVLSLQNVDECRDLFDDLFTMREQISFAQRLQIAKLLLDGETYEMVRNKTSASSSTITRINTELQFGSGGYRKVLERMNQDSAADDSCPEKADQKENSKIKTDKNFE